jgi:hypothetical protein
MQVPIAVFDHFKPKRDCGAVTSDMQGPMCQSVVPIAAAAIQLSKSRSKMPVVKGFTTPAQMKMLSVN